MRISGFPSAPGEQAEGVLTEFRRGFLFVVRVVVGCDLGYAATGGAEVVRTAASSRWQTRSRHATPPRRSTPRKPFSGEGLERSVNYLHHIFLKPTSDLKRSLRKDVGWYPQLEE
jgi:hypothetical protein